MNNKIKILHILWTSKFSGAENVACQIINMFKDENVEMVYSSQDGQIRQAMQEYKITFYPMRKFCIKEVKRVIQEYKPDIIHTHDRRAGLVAALVGGKARIISHMHVNHKNMNYVNLKTLLYLVGSKRFEHIFWVSNSCFDNYRFNKYLSGKSSILYNIINQQLIYEKMNMDKTSYNNDIIYVGRLDYQKNPERLLKVLKLVIIEKPSIRVTIVGNGELLEETKRLSTKLGLDSNISFLGYQNNPLKILHDSKVMVMTSRFEGTPMCALEAMALGVPIVSTPTDGLVDLIENGVTGYYSDDDSVLSKKIIEIVSDQEKQTQFSKNSLKRFDDLNDLKAYKNELENVYFIKSNDVILKGI